LPEVWRRWQVATWLFSGAHLEQLRSFPDIDRDQLIRFFTLTPADVAFIDPGRGRGPADRLGLGGPAVHASLAGVRSFRMTGQVP
jgi:Domain of unknown function (DUF4158)